MREGLVHSCNAYFAQLALAVGPEALLDTAARLGISVASGASAARLRATLPQAGYGQGETLASPLRMARVVAAIASGGVLRQTSVLERAQAPVEDEVLLTPAASRLLAGYMRDAVLNGTGRSLRNHPSRIAGKTGHRGGGWRRVALVVRRVRSVWTGHAPRRLRRDRRERRIRGTGGRARRRRDCDVGCGRRPGSVEGAMDLFMKARRLESRIARTIESAAQRVGGSSGSSSRTPLEVMHAVTDAVEEEVVSAGGGRRLFPYNSVTVLLAAASADARARYEAVVDDRPSLRERILDRLRSTGAEAGEVGVRVAYTPEARADWKAPDFHVEFARVKARVDILAVNAPARDPIDLTIVYGTRRSRPTR